jgi:hypothetical protein
MSNLKIRSNVHVRDADRALGEDISFLRHVRGVEAVRKMLWAAFEVYPNTEATDPQIRSLLMGGKLTRAQVDTLKWGIFCLRCGRVPVGQAFSGAPEFRCDRPDCR